RLVLNRLSSRARVLATDPPAEKLDEVDPLSRFTVILAADGDADELRALADVEGVAEVRVHPAEPAGGVEPIPTAPPAETEAAAPIGPPTGPVPTAPGMAVQIGR